MGTRRAVLIYLACLVALLPSACSQRPSSPFRELPGSDQLLFSYIYVTNSIQPLILSNFSNGVALTGNFAVELVLEYGYLTTLSGVKTPASKWRGDYRVIRDAHIPEPDVATALALGCNCHGMTFARSQVMINNPEVPSILQDQYHPCAESDADVVVFFNGNEAIHSATRCSEAGTNYYKSKEGIYKERRLATVAEVAGKYPNSSPKFYRLKSRK